MKPSKEQLRKQLLLYAVTDRRWLGSSTLKQQAAQAIAGGATILQLREKNASHDEFLTLAQELRELTTQTGVPLIINDAVDIAVAVNADGVHVGQSDTAATAARAILGPEKIIGVSAQTVEQAKAAQAAGADYLGVGAVFPTGSKDDAEAVTPDELTRICHSVSIPVVAIGGISLTNLPSLAGSGICGAAVISAIFAQQDIETAARHLAETARRCLLD